MSSVPENIVGAARAAKRQHIADLIARDPSRVARMTFQWQGWHVDLSKERLTPDVLSSLIGHARSIDLDHWISALFSGEKINLSEGRPALHTALRRQDDAPLHVDGKDVIADIRAVQARMRDIATAVREGRRLGATGVSIRTVINLGTDGAELGTRLVCDALPVHEPGIADVVFVSGVDPEDLRRALIGRDPASTLFIVTSKTFSTDETLANAAAARRWLTESLSVNSDIGRHFVAVTANASEASALGIVEADTLPVWDWAGHRDSPWSAAGLAIAIRHGYGAFATLLAGAAAMDAHFRTEPFESNLPVLLGLVGWWNAAALDHPQRIIVPYAQALDRLPSFLQQLTLESNGKRVTREGAPVEVPTAPALWGATAADAQHALFAWLHQGTQQNPVEFIVPLRGRRAFGDRQMLLVANAIAQAQALLIGRRGDALRNVLKAQGLDGRALDGAAAVRECPGNRASTMMLMPMLDAWNLGALLALWEHRTFVESVMLGINAFDRWGVELGPSLAKPIVAAIEGTAALPVTADASTQALVAHVCDEMVRSDTA